ncbi:MAG: hypothetical protein Q4D41_00155, partial [Prevotellaceae bacterium]|nr:hypothetical protein [Prevotellaceae bacterium]
MQKVKDLKVSCYQLKNPTYFFCISLFLSIFAINKIINAMQTRCHLSVLIHEQAKKYGDKRALIYREFGSSK